MLQSDALAIMKTGANVFLTGEPGAGKSYTVRQYVAFLQSRGVSLAMTASTGIAATHIGGMTIHSWSGLGIRKSITRRECKDIAENATYGRRIRNTSVLIIDEISMLDAAMLDAVDLVCRVVKNVEMPFGGMQVVFVGDFFQLPPVSRAGEPPVYFAFASQAWANANCTVCYLSEQHRQEDAEFLDILAAMRRGTMAEEHVQRLHACRRTPTDRDITKLYAHNADVDKMNADRLRSLLGKERTYDMSSHGNAKLVEHIKRGCLSPETLAVKVGARVMFTRNNPAQGFVNGSMGEVIGFDTETRFPMVQMQSGRVVHVEPDMWSVDGDGGAPIAMVRQVPLRLAWAMTVHKSQGMSLDGAYIDLGGAFAYGQGYVALSRVRSLEGLFLGGLNARALEVDPGVLRQDAAFRAASIAAEEAIIAHTERERDADADAFIASCGGSKEAVAPSARVKKKVKEPKWAKTLVLILEGKSIKAVARERERTVGTIIDHLMAVQAEDKLPPKVLEGLRIEARRMTDEVHPVMKKLGPKLLGPIHEYFKGRYSYDDMKIAKWLLE